MVWEKTVITYNVHFAQFHGGKSQESRMLWGGSQREAAFGVSKSHIPSEEMDALFLFQNG